MLVQANDIIEVSYSGLRPRSYSVYHTTDRIFQWAPQRGYEPSLR